MTEGSESAGRFGGPNPIGGPSAGGAPNDSPPPQPPPDVVPPAFAAPGALTDGAPPSWQGPPWPGPPIASQQPMMHFGPPPRNSRKRLVIALISGVVVVVIAAVIAIAVTLSGGEKKPLTAVDAVKGYLGALARGDAKAALSYAKDQPATTQFLTDDVLKKQISKWPITNIRVLDSDSLSVHVAANFGDQTSDQKMFVKQVDGGGWKLEAGAIKVTFFSSQSAKAASTLTLFGKPVNADQATYVFPGWVDFGNSNPNITQRTPTRPLLLDDLNSISSGTSVNLDYDISDAGRAGIQTALKNAFAECAKSTQLRPPNCPQMALASDLVDGTAQWAPPTDISGMTIGSFDAEKMAVNVYGIVDFQLTAKSASGAPDTGRVPTLAKAVADLSKSPPAITFK
ncbi:hypothetical protein MMARJ_20990 [Mycobacterium marseillense]|uniref:DUF4878 domain-containing protein n=2 Tax=Mycobacterium marseillense TaxID=701042 RepID=A0ABM7JBS5_9MYCO|nr:hypothetical protein BST31_20040 [Mycobacterium marseillense]BBY11359.1 hypothetical protein MMARJ_20990 [Mycobacterium marseillense]